MIHEHEQLELASAAMDFPLAPDVERELALELADCPVCSERAAAYKAQMRLLSRLPVVNASDATRRRITAAATTGRVDTRSPMMIALAAALLVGLLLALTVAAGAFLNDRAPDPFAVDAATLPPAASPSVVAGVPSPAPSEIDPGGGQVGVFPDSLPANSIVEVVSDSLRVRSQPRVSDDSIMYAPLLRVGERLFVLEGPVVASDYDWYRVVLIGGGDDEQSWADLRSGWVSRGDHDATPWIAPDSPACPGEPVEIADLTALHPLERLACFGARSLSFDAVLEGGPQSGWVAEGRMSEYVDLPGNGLAVAVVPGDGLAAEQLPDGRAVALEGSFDQCERLDDDVPSMLGCRTTFVATRAEPHPATFAEGEVGRVVTNDLQVRSQPVVADQSMLPFVLNAGTRLGVIGGPAVGSGYVWYQVAVPSLREAGGRPVVGWIASSGRDGEPWMDHDSLECPTAGGLTFAEFAALSTSPVFHGGQVCYGRTATSPPRVLGIDAHVRVDCTGTGLSTASSWLMIERVVVFELDGREATGVLTPGMAAPPCGGEMSAGLYHANGHFDDDSSSDCAVPEDESASMDAAWVYECRNKFVVSELFPAGPDVSEPPPAP